MRIVNPESFEFDQDELQALRDICDLAAHQVSQARLASMPEFSHKRAVKLMEMIMSIPFVIVAHEDHN